jgi:hypothetical protein
VIISNYLEAQISKAKQISNYQNKKPLLCTDGFVRKEQNG